MGSVGRLVVGFLAATLGCVAAPEAQRTGGTTCRTDRDCNPGATCGQVHLCVDGYCAEDTIFRVCSDGGYPEAATVAGQCLTYLNCNTTLCGMLVPCVANQCDQTATLLFIPCDGGDGDGDVDAAGDGGVDATFAE